MKHIKLKSFLLFQKKWKESSVKLFIFWDDLAVYTTEELTFCVIIFLVKPSVSYTSWLVVLRIYVALAIFQPYRDLEAGDNQSLKL